MIELAPSLSRLARAKVNLYLHVSPPEPNGYHPLQSLVMFADVGDVVTLVPKPAPDMPVLNINGPFGTGLPVDGDNLISKAIQKFELAAGINIDRHNIHLSKQLPVASGLGAARRMQGRFCTCCGIIMPLI